MNARPVLPSTHALALTLAAALGAVACGGSPPPAPQAPDPSTVTPPAAGDATPAAGADAKPAAGAAGDPASGKKAKKKPEDAHQITADQHKDNDKLESAVDIELQPNFSKAPAKGEFPKSTTDDRACWEGTMLSGHHQEDYDTIVAKCGKPTGLLEYTKVATGHVHHKHDKRDTFTIKLMKGMCYRYFAVADSGITDMDILVTKVNGAIVADDKTTHPVAIIEPDKPWCLDRDEKYQFHIEVDGVGAGEYVFGVWVRPKG